MSAPRCVVVLPGMDATGRLLGPFADSLRARFDDVRVLAYPVDVALGYRELTAYVRARLPADRFVLVGESFSGPIALSLAARPPSTLAAVVLGASFAHDPVAFGRVLRPAASIVSPRIVPMGVLSRTLWGRWETPERRDALRDALSAVAPHVLRHRASEALRVRAPARSVEVPALYLRATRDRVLGRHALRGVRAVVPHLVERPVEAPHFLFQVAPEACADAIAGFVEPGTRHEARG